MRENGFQLQIELLSPFWPDFWRVTVHKIFAVFSFQSGGCFQLISITLWRCWITRHLHWASGDHFHSLPFVWLFSESRVLPSFNKEKSNSNRSDISLRLRCPARELANSLNIFSYYSFIMLQTLSFNTFYATNEIFRIETVVNFAAVTYFYCRASL
jgi:hypothetical protein